MESCTTAIRVIGIEIIEVVKDHRRIQVRDIEQDSKDAGNDEEEPGFCIRGFEYVHRLLRHNN